VKTCVFDDTVAGFSSGVPAETENWKKSGLRAQVFGSFRQWMGWSNKEPPVFRASVIIQVAEDLLRFVVRGRSAAKWYCLKIADNGGESIGIRISTSQ
jgi:hypothetical protein